MLTICISPYDQQIITADGLSMNVKAVFAVTSGGIKVLQEFEADSTLDDVEIILIRRFSRIKRVQMSPKMKLTIVNFMRNYHAKQRMSFDCYAFVNLVNGVSEHEVPFMQKYWKTRKLTWWPRVGSVIFLLSGVDYFHHAAIYIGSGL